MKTEQSTDSLIENIGRKVPWCRECATADFTKEETTVDDRGKTVRICEYCSDTLTTRAESRINVAVDRPVLFSDINAPRSSVTRLFTSPWGKVRAHISVHSYFAPFVELNGVPCLAIKRVIDEEFSKESIDKLSELGPYLPGTNMWPVSTFLITLQGIIERVHLDAHAVPELDLDLVLA